MGRQLIGLARAIMALLRPASLYSLQREDDEPTRRHRRHHHHLLYSHRPPVRQFFFILSLFEIQQRAINGLKSSNAFDFLLLLFRQRDRLGALDTLGLSSRPSWTTFHQQPAMINICILFRNFEKVEGDRA